MKNNSSSFRIDQVPEPSRSHLKAIIAVSLETNLGSRKTFPFSLTCSMKLIYLFICNP